MEINNIDVDILVNGKKLKVYPHNGRWFIEAKHGSEYSIKIKNNSWNRVMAVITVDGLNVLDGKAGGDFSNGYVLNGYMSYEVKGFRTSHENVNAFKFSTKKKSYAAKSEETGGDTSNCGVVGVQVYAEAPKPAPPPITVIKEIIREVEKPTYTYPWSWQNTTLGGSSQTGSYGSMKISYSCNSLGGGGGTQSSAHVGNLMNSQTDDITKMNQMRCFNMSSNTTPDFDMGTEWSKNEIIDKVTDTTFEKGYCLATFNIYYASRESLLSYGIQLHNAPQVSFPQAFPGRFCKPPVR